MARLCRTSAQSRFRPKNQNRKTANRKRRMNLRYFRNCEAIKNFLSGWPKRIKLRVVATFQHQPLTPCTTFQMAGQGSFSFVDFAYCFADFGVWSFSVTTKLTNQETKIYEKTKSTRENLTERKAAHRVIDYSYQRPLWFTQTLHAAKGKRYRIDGQNANRRIRAGVDFRLFSLIGTFAYLPS